MNNEKSINKSLNLSKALSANTPYEIDYLHRTALLMHGCGFILFIINIIICLATIKNIKKNKILLVFSIIAISVSYIFKEVSEMAGGLVGVKQTNEVEDIMIIIASIIQIVIFIKLIINIVKSRKKEEP